MKNVTLKILNKLATVAVVMLLYFVLALLQAPKAARAAYEVAQQTTHAVSAQRMAYHVWP